MPEIDVTQNLIGFTGSPILSKDSENGNDPEYLDFRTAAIIALRAPKEGLSAAEKYDIERLMSLIFRKDFITLKSEDKTLVKDACAEILSPEVMAPMWRIIDPDGYPGNRD